MSTNQTEKLSRANKLATMAGLMILGNTSLLGAAVRWFPEIIPVLPGSNNNADIPFNELVIIGLTLGCLVLIGATMLHYYPENRRARKSLLQFIPYASN